MAVKRMSNLIAVLLVIAIACFGVLCSICRVDAMVDPSPDEENAKTVAAASNSSQGSSGTDTSTSKTKKKTSNNARTQSGNSGSTGSNSSSNSGSTNSGSNSDSGSDDEDVVDENAFTTPGNATLGDMVKSSGSKDFYTIKTDNDNTFYLVIDHAGNMDNVYMLSTIDENDLKDFLEDGEEEGSGSLILPETQTQQSEGTDSEVQTPAPETQKNKLPGIVSLVILIGAAVGGGIAFMRYRRRADEPEEYLSENMEDDGLPTVNEDEEYLE